MDTTEHHPTTRLSPARAEALLLQRPWTMKDVCDWFAVCENTVRAWIDRQGFPAGTRLGGSAVLRWRASDVIAWQHAQFDAAAAAGAGGPQLGRVHPTGAGHKLGVADRSTRKARP